MTANTQPIFFNKPLIWTAQLTNEVVGRIPGSAVPKILGTAGVDGSLIETIGVFTESAVSSTLVRLFGRGANDTGFTLLSEIETLGTISVELPLYKTCSPVSCDSAKPYRVLRLPPGYSIYLGLSQAVVPKIMVVATGGNY